MSAQGTLFDAYNFEPECSEQPTGAVATWDRECPLPVAPSPSIRARHASATGAQVAAKSRGVLTERYIRLLDKVGPLSDHEAAGLLGCGLSSINSIRAALGQRVIPSGEDQVLKWPNGFSTRRTRWRLTTSQESGAC